MPKKKDPNKALDRMAAVLDDQSVVDNYIEDVGDIHADKVMRSAESLLAKTITLCHQKVDAALEVNDDGESVNDFIVEAKELNVMRALFNDLGLSEEFKTKYKEAVAAGKRKSSVPSFLTQTKGRLNA